MAFLKAKLSETQALNAILQEEPVNLKEENYFLYYLVRLDRHELYKALMKVFEVVILALSPRESKGNRNLHLRNIPPKSRERASLGAAAKV